jgi:hypothetical protein
MRKEGRKEGRKEVMEIKERKNGMKGEKEGRKGRKEGMYLARLSAKSSTGGASSTGEEELPSLSS